MTPIPLLRNLLAALLLTLAWPPPGEALESTGGTTHTTLPEGAGSNPGDASSEGPEGEATESEPEIQVSEEVTVRGRAESLVGGVASAAEGRVGLPDLENRPILRPGELLEAVPGVIVTQHSGAGKANQYFLRGFNLDHGTDFRVTVAGVPVNLPTHGHGQGYADVAFLIPELVEEVRFRKGPYFAEEGDFSTAGSATLDYVSSLPEGIAEVSLGSFGHQRLLVADSLSLGEGALLSALEVQEADGPWENPEKYRKLNGLLRYTRSTGSQRFTLTATAYDGRWNATDQVPVRGIRQGLIGRFGAVDPTDGGTSRRMSLTAELARRQGKTLDELNAYLLYYDLRLFSNFTYFLNNPVNGDQFEQADRRWVAGLHLRQSRAHTWRSRGAEGAWGLQFRVDDIQNGLFPSRGRMRLSTVRQDDILQLGVGLFGETRLQWTPWLRTAAGLRADLYVADVASNHTANSGNAEDFLLSPKLSVILGPWRRTEVYLNLGYGFHSNDARGAVTTRDPATGEAVQPVDFLVRARGGDLGVRTEALPGLHTTLTLFRLDLDSELLFVGDAGTTEASRPSRRTGVEIANFYRPVPWLRLEADLSLSRPRFTDRDPAGDRIPGSIERVASVGISVENLRGFSGGLRLRHLGPRPLTEDNSVRSPSSTLLNASLAYSFPRFLTLELEVFNLLNRRVSDIDYFYLSRLPGEPARGVADVHTHPAEPRAIRLALRGRF